MSMSRIMRPGIDRACPVCSTDGITYIHTPEECEANWGPNEGHRPILTVEDALALWSRNDRGFDPRHGADSEPA